MSQYRDPALERMMAEAKEVEGLLRTYEDPCGDFLRRVSQIGVAVSQVTGVSQRQARREEHPVAALLNRRSRRQR